MIITVLTSDGEGELGCPICAAVKKVLAQAVVMLNAYGLEVELKELNIDATGPEGEEAVDLAIERELALVPSTLVGDRVFEMDDFTAEDIVDEVRKQNFSYPDNRTAASS